MFLYNSLNQNEKFYKIRSQISKKLASVKPQDVSVLTKQGLDKGITLDKDNNQNNIENKNATNVILTEAEAMYIYAMQYVDQFNPEPLRIIRDDNSGQGMVINHGMGGLLGDNENAQKLVDKNNAVPLNKTNADIIVNQMLNEEQKRFVEIMVDRFNDIISPQFREAYSEATGKAMPKYEKYLPIMRYNDKFDPKNPEGALSNFVLGSVTMDSDGRLKDKKENVTAPIVVKDLFGVMAETIQFSANYIAYRKALENLRTVTGSKDIMDNISAIPGYGKSMANQINLFEARITNNTLQPLTAFNGIEKIVNNVIQVNLWLKIRSILSQLASVPMALRYDNISSMDDPQALTNSLIRFTNFNNQGYLPWRKDEQFLLEELKRTAGSIYRRITSGFINGILDNNPQNFHLVNELGGHRQPTNRLLALQYYLDRASMSEIAFRSIRRAMDIYGIKDYGQVIEIAKLNSLKKYRTDRIESIDTESKKLEDLKLQQSMIEADKTQKDYMQKSVDIKADIESTMKDIQGLKNDEAEYQRLNKLYEDKQDMLEKYEAGMAYATNRIRKQFETQSMTSILYSPPINDYKYWRIIFPLAYRNSWNRRLITLRNRINIIRNRVLRGERGAVSEYSRLIGQEGMNSISAGMYMVLVDMIAQSFWYDEKDKEIKIDLLGKGIASRAGINELWKRIGIQAIFEALTATTSAIPFLSETMESAFYLYATDRLKNDPLQGILDSRISSLKRGGLSLAGRNIEELSDLLKGDVREPELKALSAGLEMMTKLPAEQLIKMVKSGFFLYDYARYVTTGSLDGRKHFDKKDFVADVTDSNGKIIGYKENTENINKAKKNVINLCKLKMRTIKL